MKQLLTNDCQETQRIKTEKTKPKNQFTNNQKLFLSNDRFVAGAGDKKKFIYLCCSSEFFMRIDIDIV